MIELRNRQYMTIIDCIAGEDLEQGNVIKLADHGDIFVRALKATAGAESPWNRQMIPEYPAVSTGCPPGSARKYRAQRPG